MMQQNSFLSYFFHKITILIVFSSFFVVFFLANASAEVTQKTDPFEKIDTQISEFSEKIKGSGSGDCKYIGGNKMVPYYKMRMTGPKAEAQNKKENDVSRCYRKTVQRIDQDIQDKIFTPFPSSGLACEDFNTIKPFINEIMESRKTILSQGVPDEMKKEYCSEDSHSFSFDRTSKMWNKLYKKIRLLGDFFTRDEQGKKEEAVIKNDEKKRSDRIKKNAQERVDDFVNDFIEKSILDPMYAERSAIRSRLGGLPNGNSRFLTTETKTGRDIFVPEFASEESKKKEAEAKKLLSEKYSGISHITQQDIIASELHFEQELKKIQVRIQEDFEIQENAQDFTTAYSESVINSLHPFHTTLVDMEPFLKGTEKSLKTVVNRQNVTVTGK